MSSLPIIDCEQALRLIFAYLDGELADEERRSVADHLERCRSCFSRAEFERRLKAHLAGLARVPVTPALESRVRLVFDRLRRD